MPNIIISGFNIHPPPGLTPGGKLHKFQQATVDRLTAMTNQFMAKVVADMRSRMEQSYKSLDATGKAARSLKSDVTGDRSKGVSGRVLIGSFREVAFLTNLGGGVYHPGPYDIPLEGTETQLRFFWRGSPNGPSWFRGPKVTHPGFPIGDVLFESAEQWGLAFRGEAMSTVGRGITELTSGSAARAGTPSVSRKFKR